MIAVLNPQGCGFLRELQPFDDVALKLGELSVFGVRRKSFPPLRSVNFFSQGGEVMAEIILGLHRVRSLYILRRKR